MKNIKKMIFTTVAGLASIAILTGCSNNTNSNSSSSSSANTAVSKKEEVVKAVKASIEGPIKGDKSQYDAYYGNGKYDEILDKTIDSFTIAKNASRQQKEKLFKLYQKVMRRVKIDYSEKSDNEATIRIHKLAVTKAALNKWAESLKDSGKISGSTATEAMAELMLTDIDNGKLPLVEKKVIEKVVTVEEKDGKFTIKSPSSDQVLSDMVDFSGKE